MHIKTKASILFIVLIVFTKSTFYSQNVFSLIGKEQTTTIPFQFKNNLILIPLEINTQKFTFILDTGVSKTLLFNIKANDSVKLNNQQKVKIKGLGANEYYNGIKSTNNFIKIKNVINPKAEIYLITEAKFNFSSKIGTDIHGLIGADLLKHFVVQIDYVKQKIKFIKPDFFRLKKKKKWTQIPIVIKKNKPYISITVQDKKVNLLIDSGSSDALWLFEDETIKVPNKNLEDYLGAGLSGEIHGKKAKLKQINIHNYILKNVLVAYPDSNYVKYTQDGFIRNGIIGGSILSRFKVILDYKNKQIFLKKNNKFKHPFLYNKTGLDINYNGKIIVEDKKFNISNADEFGGTSYEIYNVVHFSFKNSYIITKVKKDSSAEKAGLLKDDILIKINGIPSYNYKLEEISEKLSNNKKKIHLSIQRNGIDYEFTVPLIDYL